MRLQVFVSITIFTILGTLNKYAASDELEAFGGVYLRRNGDSAKTSIKQVNKDLNPDVKRWLSESTSLKVMGDEGNPSAAFPLGRCEADCDTDDDCEGDLECFQRGKGEPGPPGCTGVPASGRDYCYDPNDALTSSSPSPTTPVAPNQLVKVGDNGSPASVYPLGICQGDCDNDNECQGNLICFQRSGIQPVPGCVGDGVPAKDFCYDPNGTPVPTPTQSMASPSSTLPPTPTPTFAGDQMELLYAGDNGSPTSSFPLGNCQGDCDSDSECSTGLKCFQRSGTQQVPGCIGLGVSAKDYCYDPNASPVPTLTPTPFPTPSTALTEGSPALLYIGDNGSPSQVYPLGHCEGDCDNDGECESHLKCFKRSGNQPVPGCLGEGKSGKDYCYDPIDDGPGGAPKLDTSTLTSFRLRLYWQEGYFWQESYNETFWCMDCQGANCDQDDRILIKDCTASNPRFEFVYHSGSSGSQLKVTGLDLCFAVLDHRGTTRLEPCDASQTNQRWEAGLGGFNESRFDIRSSDMDDLCLTQHHHPKYGEEVYATSCTKAHRHETGYWNKLI